MSKAWQVKLQPFTTYGQRWDWTGDGMPDEDATQNCGPECVAMVIEYCAGIEQPADFIHDVIHGQGYVGGTVLDDMKQYLQKHASMHCEYQSVDPTTGKERLFWLIWEALNRGYPVIGLRGFDAPFANAKFLHYGVLHGINSDHKLIEADPWIGADRIWSEDDYWAWSANEILICQRQRWNL